MKTNKTPDARSHAPKIYLLRHGAIAPVARRTFIGQSDVPLSALGFEQARAWQTYFQPILPPTIVTSDLQRCRHTAGIIAGQFSNRITVRKALREISLGQWEGVALEDIQKQYPRQWELRGRNLKEFRPPQGESFGDLHRRAWPVFEAICRHSSSDVLIVTHAGVIRVILAGILNIDLNHVLQIPQEYAALSIVGFDQEKSKVIDINHVLELSGEYSTALRKFVTPHLIV